MKWKLLESIPVGSKIAKNRIVMAPMETRLSRMDGDVTREMIDYYAERAKGGTGIIIVENTFIDNLASRSSLSSSGFYSDHLISGKNLLAEAIKGNGAIALIQLSHGGRQARPGATVYEPVAPSAVMCSVTKVMPHALTIEEITKIEDAFAEAAYRAKLAEFDGVEIHGAHGYLVCSFLSPLTNQRTDKYGGDLKNRGRFATNIINKVRERVGRDFIVGYRISATEYVKGGLELEDACSFVSSIQDNIDYINVSAGIYESPSFWVSASTYIAPGQLIPLASKMKKSVNIPVITAGSFNPELAEKAIREDNADLIAFGRALIAEPFLPEKLLKGNALDIRPCIRGNEGCVSRFNSGCAIRCEINPACGREAQYRICKGEKSKKVLIIGGGISGMEAARIALLMGHNVTLIEKENKLGGHLLESIKQEFKADLSDYYEWLLRQLSKNKIKISLNTCATADIITREKPDALIIAIGSEYIFPEIAGINNAIRADEVLNNISIAGKRVVIVGGGLIGAETALSLAMEKRTVTIVEMQNEIVKEHEPGTRESLIQRLKKEQINILINHTVVEIGSGFVKVRDKNSKITSLDTDTTVIAAGLVNRPIEEFKGIIPDTIFIGDCTEAR
ncbi:MAG: NADH:flavin oxidoreductase, partial [Actinobacteria bacterium]|nr:NADH:flavin oxidoreductase [Actinomycetota bacterium]